MYQGFIYTPMNSKEGTEDKEIIKKEVIDYRASIRNIPAYKISGNYEKSSIQHSHLSQGQNTPYLYMEDVAGYTFLNRANN